MSRSISGPAAARAMNRPSFQNLGIAENPRTD
jgi:hypothetical protein